MSRIAKYPVDIPAKVEVALKGGLIEVKGPLGSLSRDFGGSVKIERKDNQILFSAANGDRYVGWLVEDAARYKPGDTVHLVPDHGAVHLFDAMPSVGRKFLLAGRGGLNITHSEPPARFLTRYGSRQREIAPLLDAFGPETLRAWVEALGIATFTGSSGRVFPEGMKAAPLLRAWLQRLREAGVRVHVRHRWTGWSPEGDLLFETPGGPALVPKPDATILALGGASWPRLGSDGGWVPILEAAAWVGHACWAELRLHAVLTHWLSVESDPEVTVLLWSERADAADRAEAWHRRLPELREHPRSAFIHASSEPVARLFNGLTTLEDECAEQGQDWEEVLEQRAREQAQDTVNSSGAPDAGRHAPADAVTPVAEKAPGVADRAPGQ